MGCDRGRQRRIDPSVGPGCFDIEGQRIEGRFGPLQTILSACPLGRVFRRSGTGGELGHRHGRDGDLLGQGVSGDTVEVDDRRRVEQGLPQTLRQCGLMSWSTR